MIFKSRRVPIFLGCLISLSAPCEELILRSRQLPCFEPDPIFGSRVKPGCEAKARTPWSGLINYKFNQMGLREKDINSEPPTDRIRILVMGRGLEGVGLEQEQLPSRQLEKTLINMGLTNVEVLNGVIPGYSAGRNAMLSHRLAGLKPDVVIYSQSGADFALDFAEAGQIEADGDRPRARYVASSTNSFVRAWSLAQRFWSLQVQTSGVDERRSAFLKPTWDALLEANDAFGLETKFFVAWAPSRATSVPVWHGMPILGPLFRFMTPDIRVNGPFLTSSIRRTGLQEVLLAREFNEPVRFQLAPEENPYMLTARGAERWADSVAAGIFNEVQDAGYARFRKAKTAVPTRPAGTRGGN